MRMPDACCGLASPKQACAHSELVFSTLEFQAKRHCLLTNLSGEQEKLPVQIIEPGMQLAEVLRTHSLGLGLWFEFQQATALADSSLLSLLGHIVA